MMVNRLSRGKAVLCLDTLFETLLLSTKELDYRS
jgi:hypothetical protein